MQKKLVSVVLAGLLMLCISVNAMAGAAATDVVCTGCVGTTDIANAAVTETKLVTSAVTNSKIADGAVTDAKISGQISASKIQKTANVITVAISGGDFSSIGAALASLPDPNTTPVVIKVMPGTYSENTLTMKSNVHLEGSGREVTTLNLQGVTPLILPTGVTNVEITDLKLIGERNVIFCDRCGDLIVSRNKVVGLTFSGGGYGGIDMEYATGDLFITDNIVTGFLMGIDVYYTTGNVTVRNNLVKGNEYGIYMDSGSEVGLALNIQGNEIVGNQYGIYGTPGGLCTVKENTIISNGVGVYSMQNCILSNNRITNSGSWDISGVGRGSFNIFDTTDGTLPGSYNVKSDGTPW